MGLRHHVLAISAAAVLAFFAFVSVAAPLVVPHNPNDQDIAARLLPPAASRTYPLGTDHLGRDILSRLIYGGRVSLLVGLSAAAFSGIIGVAMGLWAGYYRGWIERLVLWITDVQLSIPFLLLMIAVVAIVGPSVQTLIIVLSLANWMAFARVTRAQTLMVGSQEYVEAARAVGSNDVRILWRQIFPNVVPSVVVVFTFEVARMITTESTLSFLGLGVPVRIPSWGAMLADGRTYISFAPWLITLPGLCIALVVLAVNFLGDWLRDRLDPRLRL